MIPTVLQLPLSIDLPASPLALQRSTPLFDHTGAQTGQPSAVELVTGLVTVARTGQAVSHNPQTNRTSLIGSNQPAFGSVGIAIGPARTNVLDNGNTSVNGGSGIPDQFSYTDPDLIIDTKELRNTSLGESPTGAHVRLVGTTGASAQTFIASQSNVGGNNEWWNAQVRIRVNEVVDGTLAIRVRDVSNTLLASQDIDVSEDSIGVWRQYSVSLRLTGGASADLRWELFGELTDTGILDFDWTNAMLANAAWLPHYVPTGTGPVSRGAETVNVDITDFAFGEEMWSIDVHSLGTLATLAGVVQLQYIFSAYDGVDGNLLFMDDPNTITWRLDFNGTPENISLTPGFSLGNNPLRIYMNYYQVDSTTWRRRLVVRDLVTEAVSSSADLDSANPPPSGATVLKLGRDNADTNRLEGYVGKLVSMGPTTNEEMIRINENWTVP